MTFRSRRGQSVVEMALVLPLLLIVVFGMVDFGILIYDQAIVTNAAREGARLGVNYAPDSGVIPDVGRPTDPEIKQEVLKYCGTYLITFGSHVLGDTDVIVSRGQGDATRGLPPELTVRLRYPHEFAAISHLIRLIPGGAAFSNVTLTSTSVMRIE